MVKIEAKIIKPKDWNELVNSPRGSLLEKESLWNRLWNKPLELYHHDRTEKGILVLIKRGQIPTEMITVGSGGLKINKNGRFSLTGKDYIVGGLWLDATSNHTDEIYFGEKLN